jgi:hypothetical protein
MIPRGIRNNNPGNIRHGADWQGMSPHQDDPDFVTFLSPPWGIRAIVRILRSYQARGIKTIGAAIDRWAPPNENDTEAYTRSVCGECGLDAGAMVSFDNIMIPFVKAIIRHENGEQPYTDDIIRMGIDLA